MRVLVVEDEIKLADLLRRGLTEAGYAVDVAAEGRQGRWMASENQYDAILLDVMLPDADGFEVCAELRADGCWSPVLMLTARVEIDDRVRGLDAGADDYLTKPFAFDELLARLRSLTRRAPAERPAVLTVGELTLNPATRKVTKREQQVLLTRTEFSLLEYLMRHPGVALSRSRLIEHVWDFAFETDSNVVDVYVRYLRKKIDHPFATETLHTVRGVGYCLGEEAADASADSR